MDTENAPQDRYAEHCRALLASSEGSHLEQAAANLVIDHGLWLHRPDFLAHTEHENGWLTIRWADVAYALEHGDLVCTESERLVLEVALSLMLGRRNVDLSSIVSLDSRNTAAVTRAVMTAAGYSEQILHMNRTP